MAFLYELFWTSQYQNSAYAQLPIEFDTKYATRENYSKFLEKLRHQLTSAVVDRYPDILELPNRSTVSHNRRFIYVGLSNNSGFSVTFALDVTDAYVVAYRVGNENQSYFFRPRDNDEDDRRRMELARSVVFHGTTPNILGIGGGYPSDEVMRSINFGISPLNGAITTLQDSCNLNSIGARSLRDSLLVIILMVSEAARFRYVEQQVLVSIRNNQPFTIDTCTLTLIRSWGRLSDAIHGADNQGVYPGQQIILRRFNGEQFRVERVTEQAVKNLALIKANSNQARFNQHGHDEN